MSCNKVQVKPQKSIGRPCNKLYHKPATIGGCIFGVCTPESVVLWHTRPSDAVGQHSSPQSFKRCSENPRLKGSLENSSIFLPLSPPCSAQPRRLGCLRYKSVRVSPLSVASVRLGTIFLLSLSVYWVSGLLSVPYQVLHVASGIYPISISPSRWALCCLYSSPDRRYTY